MDYIISKGKYYASGCNFKLYAWKKQQNAFVEFDKSAVYDPNFAGGY